jgi:glycosyltransferase involved in cell wall biosynthesis
VVTLAEPFREVDSVDPGTEATNLADHERGSPVRVLVLIPSLAVGGAEVDLVRNLPRIDRTRFKIIVCTYLDRGVLANKLVEAGIEVVGPFPYPPRWRQRLRRLFRLADDSGRLEGGSSQKPIPAKPRRFLRLLGHGLLPAVLRATRTDRLILRIGAGLARATPGAHSYFQIAGSVASLVRAADIHVIHAMLPMSYVIGGMASSSVGGRPLAMSRLSLNYYHEQHAVIGVIERALLHRTVDLAIGNSTAVRDDLEREGIPRSRLRIIYNGIDRARFLGELIETRRARDRLGLAQSSLVLSVVANLWPYKGHADLLHALHLARKQLPLDWVLLVVGRNVDGHRAKLERLAEELGLAGHIRFLGERDDVAAILSACDIHVSASHTEGLPNNIIEAMCAGVPVVATAVGGVPELVVDSRTGFLVPKMEPQALAEALGTLAQDRDRRVQMGAAGRARVDAHFTIERSVAALEEVYGELAARSNAGRGASFKDGRERILHDPSGPSISPA